ncbi:MAG: hypothetical protein NZ601_07170 [candidate division WOR-3 bacterium]|nr:hypothetical protein [candidate division WOR-3 bacterium]MDW7987997.1 hypothetical protein [candidate division WOR-3 bacterium]
MFRTITFLSWGIIILNTPILIAQPLNLKDKSIFASAIIPGLGQLINNQSIKGEVMLWTEGVIWTLYSGFYWYGTSRTHDAILFAHKYANANINIKSEKYFRILERYNSAEDYNIVVRREARDLYPDDPQAQLDYFYKNGYFGDSTWNWQSDSLRLSYWDQRRIAKQAFTRASFCIGAAILNRIVSMLDCAFNSSNKLSTKINFAIPKDKVGIAIKYQF